MSNRRIFSPQRREDAEKNLIFSASPRLCGVFFGCLVLACLSYATAPVTYLVFPPENRSKITDSAWIGEALAVSIADQIQARGVGVVNLELRHQVLGGSGLPGSAPLSRASMILVAQLAGADRIIFGSFWGTSQELQASMQALDLKSMKLSGEIRASGPVSSLPVIENEISWQILTQTASNAIHSREQFREKTRVIPNMSYAHYIRGIGQPDKEGQIKHLHKAIETYPDFPQALFRLGHFYYEKGDCQTAILRLKPIKPTERFFPETQFMLGNCHSKQSNPAEAIQSYSAILSFGQQPLEVLNNLGVAYLRSGNYIQAKQNLESAKALAKTDPIVVLNLAILCHLQGESGPAVSLLEESLHSGPNQGLLHHLLGLVFASQGRSEESSAALAAASRLGIDTARLKTDDLRSLTQLFPVWRYGE